jgi:hypothetical protein
MALSQFINGMTSLGVSGLRWYLLLELPLE